MSEIRRAWIRALGGYVLLIALMPAAQMSGEVEPKEQDGMS